MPCTAHQKATYLMRQVFRPRTPESFGRGVVVVLGVSLGALVDDGMLADVDVFLSGSSQLEVAIWVTEPVLSVLTLFCD